MRRESLQKRVREKHFRHSGGITASYLEPDEVINCIPIFSHTNEYVSPISSKLELVVTLFVHVSHVQLLMYVHSFYPVRNFLTILSASYNGSLYSYIRTRSVHLKIVPCSYYGAQLVRYLWGLRIFKSSGKDLKSGCKSYLEIRSITQLVNTLGSRHTHMRTNVVDNKNFKKLDVCQPDGTHLI